VFAVPIAVPIVAGTVIKGLAANIVMRGVLQRHPNAFLITLRRFGVTLPLHRSQEHIASDIRKGLIAQGRDPDSPVALVGHSQGGLAVLRFAIDHPEQVVHVFSVGTPWEGASPASLSAALYRRTGVDLTPAFTDMAPKSPFLTQLHEDLPAVADRVTNIYSTHEVLIRPYVHAHIPIEGVTNVLIASEKEYEHHLRVYREYDVDELILGRVTHLGEMNSPEVRSLIWGKVDEIGAQLRRSAGPGATRE
jgi:pimeloyl-ACP methyl ester carboxylesterase